MFDEIDRLFFAQRAQEERGRAQSASDISVANTHMEMALEYERRAQAIMASPHAPPH